MDNKIKYIAQYRMPIGFENPAVNIPEPNTPTEVYLTESEAKSLKTKIPGIKLRKAGEPEKPKAKKSAPKKPKEKEAPEPASEEDNDSGAKSEAEIETETEESNEEAGISDDFPGAPVLRKNGFNSIEDIQKFLAEGEELESIKGIGPALSKQIVEQVS